jgi:hypothetical protein
VIVIAQHSVDAVASTQAAQKLCTRRGIGALFRNVIASQRDNIRLQSGGSRDGSFNLLPARERAVMNIG